MEFIKQWVSCICITLIISVIFTSFSPNGKMKSFYKIIISTFVFMSFLYPFKDFHLDNFKMNSSFSLKDVNEINNNSIEQMIKSQIENSLRDNEIIGASVTTAVDYNNGEIEIKNVSVAVPDEYNIDDVKNLIFDKLGINVEVHRFGN